MASNVAAHLLARTAEHAGDHVFSLRADVEGLSAAPVLEQLLVGWKAQGYDLVALRTLCDAVEPLALPRCEAGWGTVQGRTEQVLVQRDEFLGDVALDAAA